MWVKIPQEFGSLAGSFGIEYRAQISGNEGVIPGTGERYSAGKAPVKRRSPTPIPNPIPKKKNPATDVDGGISSTSSKSKTGKRKTDREPKFTPQDLATAKHIWEGVHRITPRAKSPNLDSWANTVRLIREIDKFSDQEIRSIFDWANRDEFWSSNILSPTNLRKHAAKLHGLSQKAVNGKPHRSEISKDFYDTRGDLPELIHAPKK